MRRVRIPIRIKLLGALAVPLALLLILVWSQVTSAAQQVSEVRQQANLATAISGPQGALTRIQEERNWTVVELVGMEDAVNLEVTGYDATWANTDAAIDDFLAEVENRGDEVAEVYGPAIQAIDDLEQLRQDIQADTAPRSLDNLPFGNEAFERYSEIINSFLSSGTALVDDVEQSELRVGAQLVDLSSREIELIAKLARSLVMLPLTESDPTALGELQQEYIRNSEAIQNLGVGAYESLVADQFPQEFTDNLVGLTEIGIATGQVELDAVFDVLYVEFEEGFEQFLERSSIHLDAEADRLIHDAVQRRWIYTGIAALILAASVAVSWLASYSITRPLRAVTTEATDMAEERLPAAVRQVLDQPMGEDVEEPRLPPIEIASRDEVLDVAHALTSVQDAALHLASEQAVLRRNIADSFVHLGQRNQLLLGRQLSFITELEDGQVDPDGLANLFRLDHLATRMRRYAESLLVLAGANPPRQSDRPVKLMDVIRAALGEVEHYQRVVVAEVGGIAVTGESAADISHLLAELIENALSFSPPDKPVGVRGQGDVADPHSRGYTLTVVDNGVGMAPEEQQRANRRLAGGESFTVSPSKYLGHYVAGNLAARHDITIRLVDTRGGGVTAEVHLPPHLLVAPPARHLTLATASPPPPRAPSPAVRAVPAVPPIEQAPAPHLAPAGTLLPGPPNEADVDPAPTPLSTPAPASAFDAPASRSGARPALERRQPRDSPGSPASLSGGAGSAGPAPPTQEVPWHALKSLLAGNQQDGAPAPVQPPGPRPHRPGHGPAHGAGEVKSFLHSFVDGVQRGLDEARQAGNQDQQ